MEPNKNEVAFEFPPFIRVYKDGRAERILGANFLPPSLDPTTGVSSKDVVIEPQTGLSARLYLPKVSDPPQKKLPLVIYYHGGGFVIESAFSSTYHPYLNSLVAEANVVAVSVDYRRAPEHPLPICYEDGWKAVEWVVSQAGEEEWLNKYADLDRVFMAGDSAGANIVHNMAIRAGVCELKELKIQGIVLIHPYFSGVESIGGEAAAAAGTPVLEMEEKLWSVICPLSTTGLDDPLVNPPKDPNFGRIGCKRVLVCVGEKDGLSNRGRFYYEKLGKSGWDGVVELMEAEGEDHVFHLRNPTCDKAGELMKRVVSFINQSETS